LESDWVHREESFRPFSRQKNGVNLVKRVAFWRPSYRSLDSVSRSQQPTARKMSAEPEEKERRGDSENHNGEEGRKGEEADHQGDDVMPRDKDDRAEGDEQTNGRDEFEGGRDHDRGRYDDERDADLEYDDEDEGRRRRRERSPSSPPRSPQADQSQTEPETRTEAEAEAEAEAQAEDEALDNSLIDESGRKLFIGGIPWKWGERELKDHFSKYAKVIDSSVSSNPTTCLDPRF
jgi:hypothetical protein